MDITSVDKNFAVQTSIQRDGLVFIHAEDKNEFSIHGIYYDNGCYRRLPEDVARNTSDSVHYLHNHTAGGRIRFKTNSPYIAIHVKYTCASKMPHFPFSGSIGFDLFRNNIYIGTFMPGVDIVDTLDAVIDVPGGEEADYMINFPLYSAVTDFFVGLKEGSSLTNATPYSIEKPVVYYGSSITQGGCASRPGNAYQSILSRELDAEFINLGFSGSAKAEKAISDYIASLDMSAFVFDYDHNAPTVDHLKATHKPMFDNIRKNNPNLPILLLTRPKSHLTNDEIQRLGVVYDTYNSAVSSGDKNVYIIPGNEIFDPQHAECALVDNCHPNDCGFVAMAYKILPVLKKMLNI